MVQLTDLAISLGTDFRFGMNQWVLGTDFDFGASQLVLGGTGRGFNLGEVAGAATTRGYPGVMIPLMGAVLVLMFLLLFKQLANNKIINSNDNNEKSVQA